VLFEAWPGLVACLLVLSYRDVYASEQRFGVSRDEDIHEKVDLVVIVMLPVLVMEGPGAGRITLLERVCGRSGLL
jgi:hypothetical protein